MGPRPPLACDGTATTRVRAPERLQLAVDAASEDFAGSLLRELELDLWSCFRTAADPGKSQKSKRFFQSSGHSGEVRGAPAHQTPVGWSVSPSLAALVHTSRTRCDWTTCFEYDPSCTMLWLEVKLKEVCAQLLQPAR